MDARETALEREGQMIIDLQGRDSDPMTHSESAVPREHYVGNHVNGTQLSLGTRRNWAEIQVAESKTFRHAAPYPREQSWSRSWASHNQLKLIPSDLLDDLKIGGHMPKIVLLPTGPMNVVAVFTDLAVPPPEDGSHVWAEHLNFWAITTQRIWQLAPAYFIHVVV